MAQPHFIYSPLPIKGVIGNSPIRIIYFVCFGLELYYTLIEYFFKGLLLGQR